MKNEAPIIRAPQRHFSILNSQFSISSALFAIYLLTLPIYCLLRLAGEAEWQRMLTFAIPSLLCATGLAHAVETRGWGRATLLFGSGALISFGFEALGSGIGFLFGNYSYTDKLGYKLLGLVPWLIPIAWCSMLYPAWHVADIVERGTRSVEHVTIRSTPYAPRLMRLIIAAAAITAWDLSLDPRMVQDGYWVWHDAGPYFGIPLSNYVGWFVTALIIFGVWAVVDRRPTTDDRTRTRGVLNRREWWSVVGGLPVTAYLIVWLGESIANAVFWAGPLVGLIVFVGMGIFALPVLWQRLKYPAG